MTVEYRAALKRNRLRAFFATNASVQPGQLQEVMLHETAVSWMRTRLAETVPPEAWKETREEYGVRLKRRCEAINKDCNIEALCRGLLRRIRMLQEQAGGRINK